MQQQYKDNLRIRSGMAFTKAIVDIFTFGFSGSLAKVIINSGLINVIDFGSSVISNDSESPALG